MNYETFLKSKQHRIDNIGKQFEHANINSKLFPFQRDLTLWALKKGRAAVFADTGLGKTFIQVEWARLMGGKILIIAPLSVSRQTVIEAKKIDVEIKYCRHESETTGGINITNYEMIEHFQPENYNGIVLDESSILKAIGGKIKEKLITMFRNVPYKLCCTATPAPNDIAELANHTEFLGVMTRNNMLATFFVHDDEGWRLKGHAAQPFYRWMASWAISIRRPSDLGYSDDGYDLPPLNIHPVIVPTGYKPDDKLFFTGLKGITDRSKVRKSTVDARVLAAKNIIVNGDQYLIWCGINDEANKIASVVPDSVNVQGSDSAEYKIDSITKFQDGTIKILITKPKIAGFGMNFQNCNKVIFLGLSDSYEAYYQCIRRCYRFGQTKPVDVYVVLSEHEQGIYHNVLKKEQEAANMADQLVKNVCEYEKEELFDTVHQFNYSEDKKEYSSYTVMLGDSCERMKEISNESIHLSVFSPPFQSLYVYSPTERDLGNSRTEEEFNEHFKFIIKELLRVTVTGRICAVHIADVPAMMVRDGYIGMKDLSGDVIRLFISCGWIFDSRIPIDKNQQAQSIRTHSKGLAMSQMKKDRSWLRPALPDYILKFRKPGDNPIPVQGEMTGDEWIELANPTWPSDDDRCKDWGAWVTWYGIKETDTLNVAIARDNKDERHICPLQLGTIERCIKLWSNKGETIFDPFAGICSTGYKAVLMDRKFIGIELKLSYYQAGIKNMAQAARIMTEDKLC